MVFCLEIWDYSCGYNKRPVRFNPLHLLDHLLTNRETSSAHSFCFPLQSIAPLIKHMFVELSL